MEDSVSDTVQLKLAGIDDWEWSLSTLYRSVSQAWDYAPTDAEISDDGNGAVLAVIRFTNGGGSEKQIVGQYHISGEQIDSIRLIDDTSDGAA